ncbi:MAG TPA: hypothetical protein VHB51_03005 [Candidatus Saccharimonadales bacterium]|nr:hypothetical protein [Candidatus Saccharimonadales bacterium]
MIRNKLFERRSYRMRNIPFKVRLLDAIGIDYDPYQHGPKRPTPIPAQALPPMLQLQGQQPDQQPLPQSIPEAGEN